MVGIGRTILAVLLVAVFASACGLTVTTDNSRPAHTGGIVHSVLEDGALTLDLRTHPTRDDFGMDDSSFAFYGSADHPVRVVVLLPQRRIVFPEATISAATSPGGGENGVHRDHQPKFFTVVVYYPNAGAARADTLTKAPLLHLTTTDVETASLDDPAESAPEDWRSYRLLDTEHSADDLTRTVDYSFDLDVYHNEAVDTIKRGSIVDLDLRTTPMSRAALGFLPTYESADIAPDPGRALTLQLPSPAGRGQIPLAPDTPFSSTAGPDRQPQQSYVLLCAPPKTVRSRLLAVAAPLGLDRAEVGALNRAGSSDPRRKVRIIGTTSAFTTG